MAYQNVGTPRFYIDHISWLNSLGFGQFQGDVSNAFGFNVSNPFTLEVTGDYLSLAFKYNDYAPLPYNFSATLGHKLASEGTSYNDSGFLLQDLSGGGMSLDVGGGAETSINFNSLGHPTYDGFSIVSYENATIFKHDYVMYKFNLVTSYVQIGKVIAGMYYDMPHSPDLSLTMTREYDGVKRIRTKGGVDLVDHKYYKPAMWGTKPAWELYTGDAPMSSALSRSGRRTWDLSFSYLQDSDVFPDQSSLANYETISPSGIVWDNSMLPEVNTLLNEDTFYSQVVHKTNGGQLPFIFQPDNSNNSPDNFAICKFDMSSFEFEQVANGIYNIKLKIREVW